MGFQKSFILPPFKRGFHLITDIVEANIPELKNVKAGIAHVFINHTSASLTINEDADPTVREDFEGHFNVMVPENAPYYHHTTEGPDDMPAHIKTSLLGCSVSIPVTNGRFSMGNWQGIYLCEHRNHASGRKITVTVLGE
ncbi:MAG: secondary thiamine-phosphate synthase enzyme YjbQ [Cytophagaceae bacterium]|nr:secondary thiamine-phosphate synthase enzyme YjbQ [Cytophagaceae bacterium]